MKIQNAYQITSYPTVFRKKEGINRMNIPSRIRSDMTQIMLITLFFFIKKSLPANVLLTI